MAASPAAQSPECEAVGRFPNRSAVLLGFMRVSLASKMNALTPETLQLLQTVLDETWESLRPEERSRTTKAEIGKRLLEKAKAGERDAFRLRLAAVSGVVTFSL